MTAGTPDVKAIFGRALEIVSPQERNSYLDEACRGCPQVRAEVEELLQAHQKLGSFLNLPAGSPGQTVELPAISERPGTIIGRYKLLQQIGEGGFGVVFMAEQLEPVRRKVALKVIKPGMDTKEVIARFESERQALALMDHPNIAKVFDGGETESGRPYFVMELVKGITITDYCDQVALTTRERLNLFISVCQAVQHAHQKGIIHRDIKPKNILITLHDGTPVVKVIDFGISKAIDQRLTERTLFTEFGQMIGTPMYMSPEQAEISGLDVDTRTDIYSLGVLLYELLTGATPFDTNRLHEAAYDEVRRIIREEEPPMPSKRISTLGKSLSEVSAHRNTDANTLSSAIRGDLDWIVMKALEKDRGRRYVTATAFAADIERHLQDEPIEACPPTTWYRMKKYCRRNRWLVATSGTIAVLTIIAAVAGSGGTWYFAKRSATLNAEKQQLLVNQLSRLEAEANSFQAKGEIAAAENLWREIVQIHTREFGREDSRTALSMYRLAELLASQKRHDEVINLLEQVVDIHRQVLPEDSVPRREAAALLGSIYDTRSWELMGKHHGPPLDLTRVRNIFARWSTIDEEQHQSVAMRAWLEYRYGEAEKGLELLSKRNERRGGLSCLPMYLFVLLHARMGQNDLARDWFLVAADCDRPAKDDHPEYSAFFDPLRTMAASAVHQEKPLPLPESEPAIYAAAYDRLVARYPNADLLLWRRANANALLGDWEKAAADYKSCSETLCPEWLWHHYNWIVACMWTRNMTAQADVCQRLVRERSNTPDISERIGIAEICSISGCEGLDRQGILALAEQAGRLVHGTPGWRERASVATGMALYRCGRYQDAVLAFPASDNTFFLGVSQAFSAMAYQRLGDVAKAHLNLTAARDTLQRRVPLWVRRTQDWACSNWDRPQLECILNTVIREAQSLIEPANKSTAASKASSANASVTPGAPAASSAAPQTSTATKSPASK